MKNKALLFLLLLILFSTENVSGQYFGVNLAGADFGGSNIPGTYGTHYTYPAASGLDYYNTKGLKLIRLPFLWERIQPSLNGALDAAELGRIDAFVASAKEKGMLVILDVHNYARYSISGTKYIIGSTEVPIASFRNLWYRLADHFKAEPAIWAYGLVNEPHDMGSYSWFDAAQEAINGIREVDLTHTILVAGDSWSSAQRWPTSSDNLKNILDPSDKVVYEAHQYFDDNASGTYDETYEGESAYAEIGVDRVTPFRDWLVTNNKKGFIGEYGVPGNDVRWDTVLDNFLQFLSNNCIHGTYWAGGPWWGDYHLSVEPSGGVDKPQMNILKNYTSLATSCSPLSGVLLNSEKSFKIEAGPNPVADVLRLYADDLDAGEVRIRITDLVGKIFFDIHDAHRYGSYTKSLHLANLYSGLYLIYIAAGDQSAVVKIIKE